MLVANFCGYRLLIGYMSDASTEAIEAKADVEDYTDAELVSVKTTLNLPYYTGSNEFERSYGSISINGTEYEYVKRRVYNDTLELLCLPNHAKTKLKAAVNDLAKATADGTASVPTKKSSTTVKINLPDFFQTLSLTIASPVAALIAKPVEEVGAVVPNGYKAIQERPPQVA